MSTIGQPDAATFDSPPVATTGVSDEIRASANWARQAGLLELGRRAIAYVDMLALLKDAAEFSVEMLEADFGVVGELMTATEGLWVKLVAPEWNSTAVDVTPRQVSLSAKDSLAASALRAGAPVIVADLPRESRYRDPFLEKLGVRAGLTIPLLEEGKKLGTLGLYWKRKRDLTPEDIGFAEAIACLLSLTLSRARAHAAVDCERAVATAVLDMVEDPVVVVDTGGRVIMVNWACTQATGQKARRVRERPFWEVFAAADQRDAFRAMLHTVTENAVPCQFDGHLLSVDGRQLPVSWLLREVCDQVGVVRRILLVGRLQGEKANASALLDVATSARSQGDPCTEPEAPEPQPFQRRPSQAVVERRTSSRREYPYFQWIAPYDGGSIPGPGDFVEVLCQDISAGGFSFLLDEAPEFTHLVIALGQPPHLTHFVAEVRRVAETQVDGRTRFLVGCQFRGRVHT